MEESNKINKSCDLCGDVSPKYVCPRCGVSYCSLSCYRSGPHLTCAEGFYKDCVQGELEGMRADPNDVQEMTATLQRFHLQQTQGHPEFEEEEELDSDDEIPLASRLEGIDLEDAQAVWNNLTQEERSEFTQFVASSKVEEIVEEWTPWWWKEPETKKLVQEVKVEVSQEDGPSGAKGQGKGQSYPSILESIPSMSSLTRVKPNDHVSRGLANVLGSYVWVSRLYNGEFLTYPNPSEVVGALVSLSSFLSKDAVFSSFEHSLADVSLNACQIPELFDGGPSLQSHLSRDVFRIMQGPSGSGSDKSLTLSALSDCYRLVDGVVKSQRKPKPQEKPLQPPPSTGEPETETEDSFEKLFPTGSGGGGGGSKNVIIIEPQLLRKTRRKLHYLLAFANEHPILPSLPQQGL